MSRVVTSAIVLLAASTAAVAAVPLGSTVEQVERDWTEDATQSSYNGALRLPWASSLGTWRDTAGTAQGTLAFASTPVIDRAEEQVVQWDVTNLVRAGKADMLIRRSGGTSFKFYSREATDATKRPRLIVWKDGEVYRYNAAADATLSSSTDDSLGKSSTLSTANGFLIKFNVGGDTGIQRAVLELTATTSQYGNQTLSVFRTDPRARSVTSPGAVLGTTADTVLKISGDAWKRPVDGSFRTDRMTVNADGSLTVKIPTGDDTGSAMMYSIPTTARRTTMYSRMIMKVHTDWTGTMGGKYPGLANTGMGDNRSANVCGWGSRVADGVCWSARTNRRPYDAANPFSATYQALSPYAYRYNRTTYNGEGPSFSRPIPKGKFFVLDQMVKLNTFKTDGTPNADGLVAYWINGVLVGNMTGVVWRTRDGANTLPSEFWLDVYEGGVGYVAPSPHTVTFAEVSVSTKLLPYDATKVAALNSVGP